MDSERVVRLYSRRKRSNCSNDRGEHTAGRNHAPKNRCSKHFLDAGGLRSRARAGGAPETWLTGTHAPMSVAVDDQWIYWMTDGGPVMKHPRERDRESDGLKLVGAANLRLLAGLYRWLFSRSADKVSP